jgi:hypothetical protein
VNITDTIAVVHLATVLNPNAEAGRDGALRRPRRRAQRQAAERMATCASYPARFVTPAPRGHGQRSSLSSTIFKTAISKFRFNHLSPAERGCGEGI